MKREYFEINEDLAKQAKGMISFNAYKQGSSTELYKAECNRVYTLAESTIESRPDYTDKVEKLALQFAKKYADWINTKHSIDMMCPSVMICGAGNFPTKKKERQNSRMDSHWKDLEYINELPRKIENILKGEIVIKSSDENAIEKLQEKVEMLERLKAEMIEGNKYYKKNGTLEGFKGMNQEKINQTMFLINKGVFGSSTRIFDTTNTNASIKATKQRIEKLIQEKEKGIQEATIMTGEGNKFFKVVENTEIMRLQLLFDGKPCEQVRDIVKKNGFKWSPKNGAWQRQLTENARYSLKRLTEQLKSMA